MIHWLLTGWHWLVVLYCVLLFGLGISALIVDLRRDEDSDGTP